MAKTSIRLQLEGFDELLKKIEAAGGSINNAVDICMKKSADIQQTQLQSQMRKSDVDTDLINRMPPPEINWEGNTCIARVGYKKGKYNPNNLSDGYKVVFLNYGTPRRKPTQEKARGFVLKAQNTARSQIKRMQEETLNDILGGLK